MQYSNVHHCNRSDDFQLHARESESLLKKRPSAALMINNVRLNLSIKFIEGSSHAPSHCVNRIIVPIAAGAID